ncbi:BQ5605_C064g12782 [Microbotryum silenes-dioicae]|uniref:BQ5605_C040g11839 protein n=1 Tax=Microbotryum silenes-dioicae TaxID=796604 RepID=A0A2X0NC74_9BASI|nr:BQ5605_C040g11839 [Microbotryum silenes-dioicae]SGZ35133.1 BQ5605_C064g12782 [Microbotryum silenes-dioicae]
MLVHLHDLTNPTVPKSLPTQGAILDVTWSPDSNTKIYYAGLAGQVRSVDFETGLDQLVCTHQQPVKCVEYSDQLNAVISASWDKTLRITSPTASIVLPIADKAYCLALSPTKLVIAMAGRRVWIYELNTLKEALLKGTNGEQVEVWQKRESSLKFMTRALKCMPNDEGYVTTSIEGRVAVEFFDPSPNVQAKKYAFKCHRQVIDGVDTVYPVQGLAFNSVHGTFVTGGGDGTVSIWDPVAKKRLRQWPKFRAGVIGCEFSSDGRKLAVGWSSDDLVDVGGVHGVSVREVGEDAKGKGTK